MKIFLEISTFADLKLKDERVMLLTTTNTVEGKRVVHYYGVVSGETIIGANIFRDFFASIRDIVGGRSSSYEQVLREAKATALKELQDEAAALGANAVIGIDLDYETVGGNRQYADGDSQRYGRISGIRKIIINRHEKDVSFIGCIGRNVSRCDGTKEGVQLQVLWASTCRPVLQYTYKLGNRRRVVLYVSAG